MADAVKATFNDTKYDYNLVVPENFVVLRNEPTVVLRFNSPEQIAVIQRAMGVEPTGQWDVKGFDKDGKPILTTEHSERFATWLRVQQATHMGIEESDGWWGPKTQAALEGQIDPVLWGVLKDLHEGGRLKAIMQRTEIHKATWEQVESAVEERAAAPDATEAARTLASTMKGEEIPAVEPVITTEQIVTEPPVEANVLAPSLILGGAAGAVLVAKKYFDGLNLRANNANDITPDTPRRFTIDDMQIDVPKASTDIDVNVRPPAEPLERPFIDLDVNRAMTDIYMRPFTEDATPRIAAFDGNAAVDLRVAPIDAVPATGYARLLANDPDFAAVVKEVESRLLPDLNKSFDTAANNNVVDSAEARMDAEARATVEGANSDYSRLRLDAAAGNLAPSALDTQLNEAALNSFQTRPAVVADDLSARLAVEGADIAPETRARMQDMRVGFAQKDFPAQDADISAVIAQKAAAVATMPERIVTPDVATKAPELTSSVDPEVRQAILMKNLNDPIMPLNDSELKIMSARANAASLAGDVDPGKLAFAAVEDAIHPASADISKFEATGPSYDNGMDVANNTIVDGQTVDEYFAEGFKQERFMMASGQVQGTPGLDEVVAVQSALGRAQLNGTTPDIDTPRPMAGTDVTGIDTDLRAQMQEMRVSIAETDFPPQDPNLSAVIAQKAAAVAAMPERVAVPDAGLNKPLDPEIVGYEAVKAALDPASPATPEVIDALASSAVQTALDPATPVAPEVVDTLATESVANALATDPINPVADYENMIANAAATLEAEAAKPVSPDVATDVKPLVADPVSLESIVRGVDPTIAAPDLPDDMPLDQRVLAAGGVIDIDATFESLDTTTANPDLQKALLSSTFLQATMPSVVEAEDVRLNLSDAPDTYRAANMGDLSTLSVAGDAPHLHAGQLSAIRKLGSFGDFIGPMDVGFGVGAYVLVSSVTSHPIGERAFWEMMPIIGGLMAHEEGRTAEGNMRLIEDTGSIAISTFAASVGGLVGGAAGTVAGPMGSSAGGFAGGAAGALGGMVVSIELSNAIRNILRTSGVDVDEGMNSGELTSFVGSVSQVYPELHKSIVNMDETERTSLSLSAVEISVRHSKYTMEGLSSEEAYARVREDLANEDSALAAEQKTLLEGVVGLESLTDGRPVEEALADPEAFSEIYRYYKSMATANPDDPAMVTAAESLSKYNDLALQRVNLDYGQLMVDRMGIAPQLAELEAQGPRDELVYHRYNDIIENYDEMSPEQQEQYAWIKESADRYERRMELTDGFTDARDEIAVNSRHLAHIADDIDHADAGLKPVSSASIAAEQDSLIAQMGEEFEFTGEQLRTDPSLVQGLFQRYNDSQGPLGFFSDLTNGGTYKMSEEQAGILTQFKGLESARTHQVMLESSPITTSDHVEIQLEIFRRLPLTETEDMSYPMRMLIQAKNGLTDAEGNYAQLSEDDVENQSDYWLRKSAYADTVTYMESNWAQNYGVIERQPEVFESLLRELDIGFEKPEGAMRTMDYSYKLPEGSPAPAM